MIRKVNFFIMAMVALGVFGPATDGGIWVDPNSFTVEIVEGSTLTVPLTMGNDGTGDLEFKIHTRQVAASAETTKASDGSVTVTGKSNSSSVESHDFTQAGDTPYKSGELLVRFAAQSQGRMPSVAEKNQILAAAGGGSIKRNFNLVPGLNVITLPAGVKVDEALKTFNKAKGVLYAQPNYEVTVLSTFPDDTRFAELWGMHNTGQTGGVVDADIDAPEAWDIATGSQEIIVAVIDTGVDYTHPDLAGNMWVNEAEKNGTPGVDDDGNGYVDDIYGYDFCNNDGDPKDDHYHGTHCAGTIGAIGNNSQGVAGVCWNVKIMALKFLNSSGSGWTDDAIDCVQYSMQMGANLSSNSWGGGGYSQALKDAIDAAGAAGMLFVAAAGNDGVDNDVWPHYPSSYSSDSLIAVLATDHSDYKASFSNYGLVSVDLGAPGVNILSCKPNSGYQSLSGTSMATPHVAGACALVWSMDSAMSGAEVKDILLRSVDQIPALAGKCVTGGRLNLFNALLEVKAPWLQIEPDSGTVGPGDTSEVNVTFNGMDFGPGTYNAQIVIISNDPCSPTIIPVTMTINQDDLQVTPAAGFDAVGTEGGPFSPSCMVYTLTNINETESVNWTTLATPEWISVTPSSGVLTPLDSIEVSVCIDPNADSLDPNLYTQLLIFQNADSNSIKPRSVSLTVKPPDCFTESFADNHNDLEGLMVKFSPAGSITYYEACWDKAVTFPTDPTGGTFATLWDDDFAEVVLGPEEQICFYGTCYDRFYIGSNGYLTFAAGDTEYSPSLENHFLVPRVSGTFIDLDPPNDHCISYKKLADRIAVTFDHVLLFGDKTGAANSFQIEYFYADQSFRITWLAVAKKKTIAGLSRGRGLPPVFFEESNLNRYPVCWSCSDFDRDYRVDLTDLAVLVMHWLEQDCNIPNWCGRTDMDFNGTTDLGDFDILMQQWLSEHWWLNPIAHWKFDEGEGDIAYDSADDHHGTLQGGPLWVSGMIGEYALDFDGSNDYVDLGDVFNDVQLPVTISAWILTRGDSGQPVFFSDDNPTGNKAGFWMTIGTDNKIVAAYGSNTGLYGDSRRTKTSDSGIQNDVWTFVAAVLKGPEDIDLYINDADAGGIYSGTGGDIAHVEGANARIGIDSRAPYHFNGMIDDLMLFNRALSAQEIQDIYAEGIAGKALSPYPASGQKRVDPDVILTWQAGKDALSHDVYFGADCNAVTDATPDSDEFMGNQDANYWNPDGLEPGITYYWRIDEHDGSNVYKGDVWSFTTLLDANLIGWWKLDEGQGDTAYDSAYDYHGSLQGGPLWVTGKVGAYALDLDGSNDYVEMGDIFNDVQLPVTMSAWIYKQGTSEHPIFSTDDTTGNKAGFWIWSSSAKKLIAAYGSNVSIGSDSRRTKVSDLDIQNDCWTFVAAVLRGPEDMDLYINGVDAGGEYSGTGGDIQHIDGAHAVIGLDSRAPNHYDGKIDDVMIFDRSLSALEIQALYERGLPKQALSPYPADGQNRLDPNVILSWQPGLHALSHDVYLGADCNAVTDATPDSDEFMGNQDANYWNPDDLELGITYYWRIDEHDGSKVHKGNVWHFTTLLDVNLIGWWKMDEGQGDIAYDSAYDHHGSLQGGPLWVAGKVGPYALDFDGSNDYMDLGDIFNDVQLPVTMSAWICKRGDSGHRIFQSDNTSDTKSGFWFWVYLDGTLQAAYGANTGLYGDSRRSKVSDTIVTNDVWTHVAAVIRGPEDMDIYINGVDAGGEYEGTGGDMVHVTGANASIGWSIWGPAYYDGKMDDLMIFDRSLSALEIQALYERGLAILDR